MMSRKQHLKSNKIALEMDISVKMVEKYISRALKTLRTELAEYTGIILCFIFNIL
ncbi:sigma-70 family RNA polymerase sigma factor [Sunxiuqinia indica]|uniref:hypothetical protein n=1 Tax=Sunxiuqinia indica TaxID=2692584 RepID=UPI0037420EBE